MLPSQWRFLKWGLIFSTHLWPCTNFRSCAKTYLPCFGISSVEKSNTTDSKLESSSSSSLSDSQRSPFNDVYLSHINHGRITWKVLTMFVTMFIICYTVAGFCFFIFLSCVFSSMLTSVPLAWHHDRFHKPFQYEVTWDPREPFICWFDQRSTVKQVLSTARNLSFKLVCILVNLSRKTFVENCLRDLDWFRGFNDSINNLNSGFSTTEGSIRVPAMNGTNASVIFFWFGSFVMYLSFDEVWVMCPLTFGLLIWCENYSKHKWRLFPYFRSLLERKTSHIKW